jgi:hypothetical protein
VSTGTTYIPDPDGALTGLGKMLTDGDQLSSTLATAFATIKAKEADKPWGTSDPGKHFEQIYTTGEGGAQAVETNAPKLAQEVVHGAELAKQCITNVATLDGNNADALFRIDPAVSAAMTAGNANRAQALGGGG